MSKKIPGSRIIINGASKSGKTTLLMKLLKQVPKKKYVVLISSSLQQDLYQENMELFDKVYPQASDDIVDQIFELRQTMKNSILFFVVFDDIGASKDNYLHSNSSTLKSHVANAAHEMIHYVFLCQQLVQLGTIIRDNVDVIYTFNPSHRTEHRMMMNEFLPHITPSQFKNLIRESFVGPNKQYNYLKLVRNGNKFQVFLNGEKPAAFNDIEELKPKRRKRKKEDLNVL